MRTRRLKLPILALVLLALPACKRGETDPEAVAPVLLPVLARFDAYVQADMALDDAQRKVRLDDSGFLRGTLQAAREAKKKIKVSEVSLPLTRILDLSDAYLKADAGLTDLERGTYLDSNALLRRLHDEALRKKKPPAAEPQSNAKPQLTTAEVAAITYGDPLPKPKDAD